MTASVQLQNVTFAYRRGHPVLDHISLTVPGGTFLAVVGPNGAGKSTLLSLLAGLLKPQTGTIRIDDVDLQRHRQPQLARRIAVVRQEFVPAFGFSVAETVMMARTPHYGQWGFETPVDRQIVAEALELTDTAAFASRSLADLSGGERQRVFIARALAQNTPILLLDEPTSFLDLRHQVGIYDLLKSIQRDKERTIIAITHDISLASQYCDQALLLRPCVNTPNAVTDGSTPEPARQYSFGTPSEVFTPSHIEAAFAVRVFSASVGRESVILPLGRMARDANRLPPRLSGPATKP